jgi:hypothetical protein
MGRIKRFRRSEQGYILPLMLFMMLLFTSILFYMVDTGDAILRKTRLQQAADSAAISQAEWSARSLNVISMNNVAQTQLHTTRIIGASLHTYALQAEAKTAYVEAQLLIETGKVNNWNVQWCKTKIGCLYSAPITATWMTGMGVYQGFLLYNAGVVVYKHWIKYEPMNGYEYSHSAFEAIYEMDDYLLDEERANDFGAASFELAEYHGAENLYTFGGQGCSDRKCGDNNPIGMGVPATKGSFSPSASDLLNAGSIAKQFCDASKKGTPSQTSRLGYAGYQGGRLNGSPGRGYPTGRGPWMHSGGETAFKHVNDETKMARYVGNLDDLWRDAPWPGFYGSGMAGHPGPERPIAQQKTWLKKWPPDGSNRQSMNSNAFLEMSEKLDDLYCSTFGVGGAVLDQIKVLDSFPSLGILPNFARMTPRPVGLKGMQNAASALGSTPSSLLERFTDSRYMSVFTVARDEGKISLPDQDDKISIYAYSQAQIYNPSAPDLYSQNWRARLVQASFLNGRGCNSILQNNLTSDLAPPRPEEVLDDMGQKAGGGFEQFIDSFDSFRSSCEDWGDVVVY